MGLTFTDSQESGPTSGLISLQKAFTLIKVVGEGLSKREELLMDQGDAEL